MQHKIGIALLLLAAPLAAQSTFGVALGEGRFTNLGDPNFDIAGSRGVDGQVSMRLQF